LAHASKPAISIDLEDLDAVVGDVRREEMRSHGRKRERPHGARFEMDKRVVCAKRCRREECEEDDRSRERERSFHGRPNSVRTFQARLRPTLDGSERGYRTRRAQGSRGESVGKRRGRRSSKRYG